MTLVDTSVWIDHFRSANEKLVAIPEEGLVHTHPHVISELARGTMSVVFSRSIMPLGNLLRKRTQLIESFQTLPDRERLPLT